MEIQSFRLDLDKLLFDFASFIRQVHEHQILRRFLGQAKLVRNDFFVLFFFLFKFLFILFHWFLAEFLIVLHGLHVVITGSNIPLVNFIKRFVLLAIHNEFGFIVVLTMVLFNAKVNNDAFEELPRDREVFFALATGPDDVLPLRLTLDVLKCTFEHDLLEFRVVDFSNNHFLLFHLTSGLDDRVIVHPMILLLLEL